ncbi:hypothetical protein, partial [Methanobrevibacter sp.]
MNKKILIIMMCVMVMTLSLTAISAVEVENNHNDTITGEASQLASQEIQDSENELLADNSNVKDDSVDENLLKNSDENDLLTDDEKNFTSLQELIDSQGNYVELDDDYKNYYDSDTEQWENPITINKNLTINGKGHYIDAADQSSNNIFKITGEYSFTLINVTLRNANYGIFTSDVDTIYKTELNCENVIFDNVVDVFKNENYADEFSLTLNNIKFENDGSSNLISIENFQNVKINISNTKFDNNKGITITQDSGVTEGDVSITLNNVEVTNSQGDFISIENYKNADINFTNTVFNQNSQGITITGVEGDNSGDINFTLNNMEFEDNQVNDYFLKAVNFKNANINFTNTNFTKSYGIEISGISDNDGDINFTLNNVEFDGNLASEYSLKIVNFKNANINFTNTSCNNNGGMEITGVNGNPGDINFTLNAVEFESNMGQDSCFLKIADFKNANMNFTNTNFTSNYGISISGVDDQSSENGGYINLNLNDSEFNNGDESSDKLIKIVNYANANINITNTTFKQNTKGIEITGVGGNPGDINFTLNTVEFEDNYFQDACFLKIADFKNANVNFTNASYNNNGGIEISGISDNAGDINFTLNTVNFEGNMGQDSCFLKIADFKNANMNFTNTNFTSNYGIYISGVDDQSSENGGYITLNLNDSEFNINENVEYLKIEKYKNANINITNTTFKQNTKGIEITGVEGDPGDINFTLNTMKFDDNNWQESSFIKIAGFKNANVNFTNTTFKQNNQGIEITGVQSNPGDINFTLNTVELESNGVQESSFFIIDYFKNANINFTNTNFTNNYGISISGVDSDSGDINFTSNNVTFEKNKNGKDNYFIYIVNFKNANMNFTNTTYNTNYGMYISGVDSDSSENGGYINLNLNDSEFNNGDESSDKLIKIVNYANANINISNTTFRQNTKGIEISGIGGNNAGDINFTLNNSTFEYNEGGDNFINIVKFKNANMNFTNITYYHNYGMYISGVYEDSVDGGYVNLNMKDSEFNDIINGGYLINIDKYTNANVNISNTTFKQNRYGIVIEGIGGNYAGDINITLNGADFVDNLYDDYALYTKYFKYANVNITNITFNNNHKGIQITGCEGDSGVYAGDINLTLNEVKFTNNNGEDDLISCPGYKNANVNITNTTFINNENKGIQITGTNKGETAGNINMTLNDVEFRDNTGKDYLISCPGYKDANVNITDTKFINNTNTGIEITGIGEKEYSGDINLTLNNVNFTDNSENEFSISTSNFKNANVNISNTKFINNDNIGIKINGLDNLGDVNMTLNNTEFKNNTGDRHLISINYFMDGNVNVSNTKFINNEKCAIDIQCVVGSEFDNALNVTINNTEFKNNTGEGYQISITGYHNDYINITNTTFTNSSNTISISCAPYTEPGEINVTISDVEFRDNIDKNDNKLIYISLNNHNGNINISNTNFTNNNVGIHVLGYDNNQDNVTFTLHEVDFTNDYSTKLKENAILYIDNVYAVNLNMSCVNFTNMNLNNKDNDVYGSAVYIKSEDMNLNMSEVKFTNCTSYSQDYNAFGGAVYLESKNSQGAIDLNMTDTVFTDCSANSGKDNVYGGAIFVNYKSSPENVNLNIADSEFINCNVNSDNSEAYGGAISIKSSESENPTNVNLNLTNVTFTNCTANSGNKAFGGAVYIDDKYSNVDVNITNCSFVNNTAINDGGAIYSSIGLDLINCSFVNNTVNNENGGAIYSTGVVNLTNCSFVNNTAKKVGGAVYCYGIHINNATFTNNTVESEGGAVYVDFKGLDQFEGYDDSYGNYKYGLINFGNATFVNNTANVNGGAVYIKFNEMNEQLNKLFVTFDNATFANNTAGSGSNEGSGGAVYIDFKGMKANNALLSFNNVTFVNNTASYSGGAVYTNNEIYIDVNLTNCTFENNTALNYGGGAIYANDCLYLNNCSFVNNAAEKDTAIGGAVYCYGIHINNATFTNNTVGSEGGAVYVDFKGWDKFYDDDNGYNYCLINFGNATFVNNTAYSSGGAVYIKFNSFEYPEKLFITFDNVTFANNTAGDGYDHDEYGGAVYVNFDGMNADYGLLSFDNVTFVNNSAIGEGGAVCIHNKDSNIDVNLTNCTFENNTAHDGGAIYSDVGLDLINCSFVNNTVLNGNGGAIYCNGVVNLTNTTFENNSAREFGGAVYCCGIHVNNATFTNNTVVSLGGAVYVDLSSLGQSDSAYGLINFTNATFVNNTANSSGGAVYIVNEHEGNVDVNLTNCTFENNAAHNGGALYVSAFDVEMNFTKSTFKYNTAEEGGAIYIASNQTVLYGATFINNTAYKGGAVYNKGSLNVSDTIFLDNKANSTELNVENKTNSLNITLIGEENYLNAIYSENTNVNFTNVTYWNGNITNTDKANDTTLTNESGQNITIIIKKAKTNETITKLTSPKGYLFLDFSDSDLESGEYEYLIYHPDDRYYTYIYKTGILTIDSSSTKVNLTVSVENIEYGQNATINVTLKDVNGNNVTNVTVNVTINGTTYIINITNGTGSRNVSGLAAGTNYLANATFKANSQYGSANATDLFNVTKVNSTLTVNNITFVYGGSNTTVIDYTGATNVTANVIGHPQATVIIGNKNITVSGLGAGNYTLNVTTQPDNNHTAVTKLVNITVYKANSSVVINPIVNVTYGNQTVINFTVVNATEVTWNITDKDGNVVVSGTGLDNITSKFAVGNYTITIRNADTVNITGSSAEMNFTVYKANS